MSLGELPSIFLKRKVGRFRLCVQKGIFIYDNNLESLGGFQSLSSLELGMAGRLLFLLVLALRSDPFIPLGPAEGS